MHPAVVTRWIPRGALLLAVSLASGCGVLPDDHALTTMVNKSFGRLCNDLSPARAFEAGSRRLDRLTRALRATPSMAVDRTGRLERSTVRTVDLELTELERMPGAVTGTAGQLAGSGVERLGRLTEPDTLLLAPGGVGRRLNRRMDGLLDAPDTLGLNRQMFPEPTDPGRETELSPTAREPSFFERILHRIRL